MDPAVVPAVLAYKGGELFANIMRIVDEIPPGRSLSTDSLELVLRRYVWCPQLVAPGITHYHSANNISCLEQMSYTKIRLHRPLLCTSRNSVLACFIVRTRHSGGFPFVEVVA